MFQKLKSTSLQIKAILCIVVCLVVLLGGVLLNRFFSGQAVRNHISEINSQTLHFYAEMMDSTLNGVEKFLMEKVITSQEFIHITYSKEENDELRLAKVRLHQELEDEISFINWGGGFFLYSEQKGMQFVVKSDYDQNRQFELSASISRYLESEDSGARESHWALVDNNGQTLLIKGYYSSGLLLGAWIPVEAFIQDVGALSEDGDSGIWITSEDGVQLVSAGDFSETEEHLVVQAASGLAPVIWHLSANYTRTGHGDYYEWIGLVLFVSLFIIIGIIWWWMYRSVLKSTSEMVVAMKEMDYNRLDVHLSPEGHASEFRLLFSTFNEMIATIKNLKMDITNETLEKEKAEIESLQLQIKPHFFLNSMNIIYELAELKNFEMIQTMTRCIMEYMRYSFNKVDEMINLGKEIHHIESYMTMQKMRYQGLLDFRMETSTVDTSIKIPPFIIQPFIENAIKYGADENKEILISIDAWQEEDEVVITIHDSGPGFPKDVVDAFANNIPLRQDNAVCVGITNVKRRLYYSYRDRASLAIYNDGQNGATVEIVIPTEMG